MSESERGNRGFWIESQKQLKMYMFPYKEKVEKVFFVGQTLRLYFCGCRVIS
jgi:hypothetical protein